MEAKESELEGNRKLHSEAEASYDTWAHVLKNKHNKLTKSLYRIKFVIEISYIVLNFLLS